MDRAKAEEILDIIVTAYNRYGREAGITTVMNEVGNRLGALQCEINNLRFTLKA